jgi:PHP family Zn ribbon phosphoesterase
MTLKKNRKSQALHSPKEGGSKMSTCLVTGHTYDSENSEVCKTCGEPIPEWIADRMMKLSTDKQRSKK